MWEEFFTEYGILTYDSAPIKRNRDKVNPKVKNPKRNLDITETPTLKRTRETSDQIIIEEQKKKNKATEEKKGRKQSLKVFSHS